MQASLQRYQNKNPRLNAWDGVFVPHIGELSNQYKADLQLLYTLKPLLPGTEPE